jgi:hypothetical protein
MEINKKVGLFVLALMLIYSSVQSQDRECDSAFNRIIVDSALYKYLYEYLNLKDIPFQPPKNKEWKFVEDIKKPMWTDHGWKHDIPKENCVNLSSGVDFRDRFQDPNKLLETAYQDLYNFFEAGNVHSKGGKYIIETIKVSNLGKETFQIEVDEKKCRILATDVEGIRRGIFYIEDEMLRLGGAFLPFGTIKREPILQHRISRSFFAPIKRPGNLPGPTGDELLDGVDYFPDQLLNRLVHEGVNGLWITVSKKAHAEQSKGFTDLVSTSVTQDPGINGEKRLSNLKRIVNKCLRYGIRIYIFTMEPHVPANAINDSIIKNHPDILGNGNRFLCASNEIGQRYLYEAVNKIFKSVPDLGGIINISHGEMYTTCLSALPATGGGHIDCPRCSKMPQWEILYNSLSAMKEGMKDAAPNAELISWLYMPQPQTQSMSHTLADWVYTIPAHTPEGVILQFNFESGVKKTVFGKELVGGDYWIATPGPSSRFERIAEIAQENHTRVSAKIQTGTSYSVATVPFVPVPSLLYEKFSAMRRLGVSSTMLNWIVGASPGLMNKAAGILSFEPFPKNVDDFLTQLASIYWRQEDVPEVITAWKFFSAGYQNYPLDNKFQYCGPMNDGPVWPLLLKPLDSPLSSTYALGIKPGHYPGVKLGRITPLNPSGDRIGECFPENFTPEEMIDICKQLSSNWDRGVEIMSRLEPKYINNHDRILDISLIKALGIQFRSGYNILRFYYLRDKMFRLEGIEERLQLLGQLKNIIKEEIALDEQLIFLCKQDPRLGFHADAEGYKYFPGKIEWRIEQLEKLLSKEVHEFELKIRNNELLFPEYTGEKPNGPIVHATFSNFQMDGNSLLHNTQQYNWQPFEYGRSLNTSWAISYDENFLYVFLLDSTRFDKQSFTSPFSNMRIRIQHRRLWPSKIFSFSLTPENRSEETRIKKEYESGHWIAVARIPLLEIGLNKDNMHPIRFDISIEMRNGEIASWRSNVPFIYRFYLGNDNPLQLGWVEF